MARVQTSLPIALLVMFTCGCPGDDATTAGDGTATDGTFGESAATSLTMTSTGTEGTDGLGSTGDSGTGSDEELDCPPVHVTLPNFDEALVVREWLDGEEHIDLADTGGLCDDLMSGPGALTTGDPYLPTWPRRRYVAGWQMATRSFSARERPSGRQAG